MQVANLGGAAPNIKTESGKTDKNPETVSSSVQFDDNQGLVVNNPKIGEGGTGANSGLTPQHSGQDKQALADADAEDIQLAAKQTNQIETDKFVTRMNNEIAQLNQSVQTSKPTEMDVISKPFGHPDWNNELGQKLIWMHKQDMPSAELRLNPEHLGPISVKIDVNHDMTTISFTAQHAEVKEAIEAAIPKLREMLGGQLSSSLDVNVSQQSDQKSANAFFQSASGQGQGKQSGQNPEFGHSEANPKIELVDEIDAGRASVSNGLLSLFA
jgi:flagellar hook-length control protein FliK